MPDKKVDTAKILSADIRLVRGTFLNLDILFDYDYGRQKFPTFTKVNTDLIKRFIRACGKVSLSDCVGSTVKVTHTVNTILKIEPVGYNDGVPFNIKKWKERIMKGDK